MSPESKAKLGRPARVVAWALLALSFSLGVLALALAFSQGRRTDANLLTMSMLMVPLGVLILFRSSSHRIGWLLTGLGVWGILPQFVGHYARQVRHQSPDRVPLLEAGGAWLEAWAWFPFLAVALMVLPQSFPTGRPLPGRWSTFYRMTIGVVTAYGLVLAIGSLPVNEPFRPMLERVFGDFLGLPVLAFIPASAVSLVVRYRRSSGDERQQIKWISFALGLLAGQFMLSAILSIVLEGDCCAVEIDAPLPSLLFQLFEWLTLLAIPVAIAISILKYRLYDIDLLIKGSLVYGSLTGLLALTYFGSVLGLQRLFSAESQIAIVLSTLAIAALFSPLRRRIQAVIDRRFYRRRYDAEKALAAFGEQLQGEVDLEQISDSLLSAIEQTVQPEYTSLWLRRRP